VNFRNIWNFSLNIAIGIAVGIFIANGLHDSSQPMQNIFSGNVVPDKDNTYSLGTSDLRWAGLQLGPGTLFIEDTKTGKQAGITISDGTLLIDGANSVSIGNTKLTLKGIQFPDGTTLTSAGNASTEQDKTLCISKGINQIYFGSCSSLGIEGTDLQVLVK